jgi:hypothetical protein
MTSDTYHIEIEDGGEFDVQFTRYAQANHRGAARLIKRLEAFARKPKSNGDFIRGSGTSSIFVVPSKDKLDGDGEAGLFALVDGKVMTICPVRFLAPSSKHRWKDYENWAETILGI